MSNGLAWPASRVAKMRHMWAEGFTATDIAEELGVTRSAVLGKAHRIGLKARATWTLDRLVTLKKMYVAGCTTREIANAMGVSTDAVLKKLKRLEQGGEVRRGVPGVRNIGPAVDGEDWTMPTVDRVEEHASACLSQGGFPRFVQLNDKRVLVWPAARAA